ncbi:two-component system, OmpR family, sensor histidine kinase PfeS [Halopseudomonas sabulinigri]|uniref:histidine kinase n=1 Tax=Halopseudomonas sabulinigri TaxID=472181 RepID=A0A1H1RFN0_9GAMM|nr:sensor histidine kinase [Halopseudomonas sabulinigri]SDS34561.1 two-component system, OmpR family, sensor histidine kinase PfeS [Halopseudomonas sabulinigri]
MNRRLWWKLCATLVLGMLALFWLISHLTWETEEAMSFIAESHQRTLRSYGAQAEALYNAGNEQALSEWLRSVQEQENTWAAVIQSDLTPIAGSTFSQRFTEGFGLGRDVSWKIHLYFAENPTMDLPFSDGRTHFVIQLPERMRPGNYWSPSRLLLQVVLPFAVLLLVCLLLYRHLMHPLRRLELATRRFSEGDYSARVGADLGARKDELAGLARAFDGMAERTQQLIENQRQRLSDMSHELRTPLTRIEMAVSLAEQQQGDQLLLERIRGECNGMRQLVEDALTLSWLENESPVLRDESLDLTELVDSIVDDARFEYPEHKLNVQLPASARLSNSSHRALGQAIENVVRNALDHTPRGGSVQVSLVERSGVWLLSVADCGAGVPGDMLERIFQPFFRLSGGSNEGRSGFGLGLALARRQVQATGGSLSASNGAQGGLVIEMRLPRGGLQT